MMTWTGLRIGQARDTKHYLSDNRRQQACLTSSWGMSPSWHKGCWVWCWHSITVPTDPLGVVHPACDQCSAAAHLSLPPRPSSEPSDGFWWQLYLCAHVVPWQVMHCTFEGFNLLKAAMPIFKYIHLEILSCRAFTPNIAALLLQSRYPIREIHFVPLELLPAVQLDLLQPATASGSRQRPFPWGPKRRPKAAHRG